MSKSERVEQAKLPLAVMHHKHRNDMFHKRKYLCNIFTSLFKIYIFPFSLTLTLTITFRSKELITGTTYLAKAIEQQQAKIMSNSIDTIPECNSNIS